MRNGAFIEPLKSGETHECAKLNRSSLVGNQADLSKVEQTTENQIAHG